MKVRQLLILAGGKGTRLGEETKSIPKPLVKIFGEMSMLDLIIHRFAKNFSDVVILAGHLSEQISEHIEKQYKDKYPNVRALIEETPVGTAGPLKLHESQLDDFFLIMNGDTWLNADPNKMSFRYGQATKAQIAVMQVKNSGRYGSVYINELNQVINFIEKDNISESIPRLINAGWCLASRSIIDEIDDLPASLEIDIFPKLIKNLSLEVMKFEGSFIDIGVPSTLEFARANQKFFETD